MSLTFRKISDDDDQSIINQSDLNVNVQCHCHCNFFFEVTHSCDSEFLSTVRLVDFQSEDTNFLMLGDIAGGKSALSKAKKSNNNKGNKLIDVTQLKARFQVKLGNVARMSQVALDDVIALYQAYHAEEGELFLKFQSVSAVIVVMIWIFRFLSFLSVSLFCRLG